MTGRRASVRLCGAVIVIVLACPVGLGCSPSAPAPGQPLAGWTTPDGRSATIPDDTVAAARAFIDGYVEADGRVVRRDQGGDTVSEAQAYGLLIAVAIGDKTTFDLIWQWTVDHLQRDDALLSWRWADGAVVDAEPAADADLAGASALVIAAERFGQHGYLDAARRIAAAILAFETIPVGFTRVLVAGPWARTGRIVNVGYFMFDAMARLGHATGDATWAELAANGRTVLARVTAASPHLPPDWSHIDAEGNVTAVAAPDGRAPRFGYEAARAIVQLAVDCNSDSRRLAAATWPHFAALQPGQVPAEAASDGTPIGADRHPVALVAAAASAHAARHDDIADRFLAEAAAIEAAHTTYFGAAWLVLARVWLAASRQGGCAAT